MNTVFKFKSKQVFYEKEREGIKNNTVRIIGIDEDKFQELIYWNLAGYNDGDLQIKIVNADNHKQFFVRDIRDISIYHGLMIITWNHKEE